MLYNVRQVEFLTLPTGRCPVEEFLVELNEKIRTKIERQIEILKLQGFLPFPHARKLQGYRGLWELRVLSASGAIRMFYICMENKIIFVSGFIKKSRDTPKRELAKALQYLKTKGVHL